MRVYNENGECYDFATETTTVRFRFNPWLCVQWCRRICIQSIRCFACDFRLHKCIKMTELNSPPPPSKKKQNATRTYRPCQTKRSLFNSSFFINTQVTLWPAIIFLRIFLLFVFFFLFRFALITFARFLECYVFYDGCFHFEFFCLMEISMV